MPAAPANGKWTAPPRVVNRLHYRLDRSGYTRTGFNHIFIVPADGGTAARAHHGRVERRRAVRRAYFRRRVGLDA